jgi:hypothetical protein
VELGRAPAPSELGDETDVRAGWRRLHDAHAIVLNPATDELRMANPFSAVPTAYRVRANERWWYGNCAWDAFGILAALDVDGDPYTVSVTDGRIDRTDMLFHCPVPAAHWWDDIVFT